jgi:hypothetical protein
MRPTVHAAFCCTLGRSLGDYHDPDVANGYVAYGLTNRERGEYGSTALLEKIDQLGCIVSCRSGSRGKIGLGTLA